MKTVKTFKCLGSMFDANGGAEKDVNNIVKIAWSKWRETTGVICDRNIQDNTRQDKTKKEERKLPTTEMHMLWWARGKTR